MASLLAALSAGDLAAAAQAREAVLDPFGAGLGGGNLRGEEYPSVGGFYGNRCADIRTAHDPFVYPAETGRAPRGRLGSRRPSRSRRRRRLEFGPDAGEQPLETTAEVVLRGRRAAEGGRVRDGAGEDLRQSSAPGVGARTGRAHALGVDRGEHQKAPARYTSVARASGRPNRTRAATSAWMPAAAAVGGPSTNRKPATPG